MSKNIILNVKGIEISFEEFQKAKIASYSALLETSEYKLEIILNENTGLKIYKRGDIVHLGKAIITSDMITKQIDIACRKLDEESNIVAEVLGLLIEEYIDNGVWGIHNDGKWYRFPQHNYKVENKLEDRWELKSLTPPYHTETIFVFEMLPSFNSRWYEDGKGFTNPLSKTFSEEELERNIEFSFSIHKLKELLKIYRFSDKMQKDFEEINGSLMSVTLDDYAYFKEHGKGKHDDMFKDLT